MEGKWRCLECKPAVWKTGTFDDWLEHWRLEHKSS